MYSIDLQMSVGSAKESVVKLLEGFGQPVTFAKLCTYVHKPLTFYWSQSYARELQSRRCKNLQRHE
jgi:hypothetical protein